MAKRVDQVGLIGFAGQMGRGSKWVNWVTGQSGRGSSQVVGQVKLAHIFQTIFFFFFFEINVICQLFLNSLTVIRFSLVMLLPFTNCH